MIAGLVLFLILPLVIAGVAYVLRRWATLSALLSIGAALALGILIVVLPLGRSIELWGRRIVMSNTVTFLGRELVMEQTDRLAIAFLFLTAAGTFALAWRVTPRALLFPIGLGMLSMLSGSLLIRPLIYAVLLLEIAAVLSVFALQIEGQPSTRGGLQYLSFSILALPGLMVIHWLMERYALTPDNTGLLDASAILMVISFGLLLGSVPFHIWVPGLASDSEPLTSAFVLTVSNGAIWFLLLAFLETYPELGAYSRFGPLTSNLGLAMVVAGGLMAAAQQRLSRLMGYGALVDTGGALIALGMNSAQGLTLVFLSLLVRPFGLLLMAAGVKGLQTRRGGENKLQALRGVGWEAPWSTLALLVGGLSVAGLPVSAGFTGRWSLYRALAPSGVGFALLLALAGVGLMIGVWRGLATLLTRPRTSDDNPRQEKDAIPEGWLTAIVLALGILACAGVGLFPQFLAPVATRLAEAYTFFAP